MSSTQKQTVIIFGPTGNIGSFAARAAHKMGCNVILAMRDPSKPIRGLPDDQTQGYTRVKADLTDPTSLAAAVTSTDATRAYMYLAHGSKDHMLSSLEALKSAGITFIVFLSSSTVGSAPYYGDPSKVPSKDVIPYGHAQVELNLTKVFDSSHFVAIRPGYFVTNLLRYKDGIHEGQVKLFGSGYVTDCITPIDMGEVSGHILASQDRRKTDGSQDEGVYLFGPQTITLKDAIVTVAKVLGKEVSVVEIGREEATEQEMKAGFPRFIIDNLMDRYQFLRPEDEERPQYKVGLENVRKYLGREATGLEAWTQENRELFKA